MPFQDQVDDYATNATGVLTAVGGEQVGYTVTSGNNPTGTYPNTDQGAQVFQSDTTGLQIDFDAPVTGLSLTFDRSNSGETYFVRINGVEVDLIALTGPGVVIGTETFTATFVATNVNTGAAGNHFLTPATGGISSSGTFNDGSIGSLTLFGNIDSVGVFGKGGGGFDIIEVGIDTTFFDVLCFADDTLITTPDGPVAVVDLRANDVVTTVDGGAKRIALIRHRHFRRSAVLHETRLRPVLIAAGALGNGLPHKDLTVSRQHRILVASRIAERLTRHRQVLLPAIKLVGLPGISIARTITPIDYYHILLDGHDVILANGAPAETLFCGPVTTRALDMDTQDFSAHPQAALGPATMRPARPMPDGKLAKKIVAAHRKHARPLLEEWNRVDA